MAKIFMKRGNLYNITDDNFDTATTLDDGVYREIVVPPTGDILLERIADKFDFNFKLYGLDEKLVSHVIDTYNKQEAKHNLGVLLNGAKGTGKTVTAKYLCNRLGLPVIIVDTPSPMLTKFISEVNHDCVFLFDEFEKNFRFECGDNDNAGEDLLSVMDGVYNKDCCHVFILTTNELRINDNLISRPSRIRYLKSFGEVIDKRVLEEYIDDNLTRPEYKEEILEFIDSLTMATIDIVKTIVDEVNLHNCHVDDFKDFFNVKEAKFSYYSYSWWVNLRADGIIDEDENKENFLSKLGKWKRGEVEEIPSNALLGYNYPWRPNFDSVVTRKPLSKYKEGERLNSNGSTYIKEIDLANHYIFLGDFGDRTKGRHVYIENLDVKPSLYDTYGYND